jgi:hypothetical protein
MASFPLLRSGAATQFPAPQNIGLAARALLFFDGSDQRYLAQGRTFRQWQIRLDLLNESEIQELEAFFAEQSGD